MTEQEQRMQEVLKKALVKIKILEAELKQEKDKPAIPVKEPIAIIGLGCRFPGGIDNLSKLWNTLIEKKDLSKPIPKERWDNDAIYSDDTLQAGKTNARSAMFLEHDVRTFDAPFFGIPPREATSIDPLQRMILEVVYEALEEANIPSQSLRGSNTAVYIAIGNSDYVQAKLRSGDLKTVDVYDTTGIPFATAAGRVSYQYDLQGANFALDAACASSIVCLDLASKAIQRGEADVAIVASANLILTPELFVGLSKLGSLSPTGQCRAFSNDADGYMRGEGCGVAILKKKSDAIRDKNHIHAYILGSAVKHDGRSNGFTAPNPKVQLETIREAIQDAQIRVDEMSFVEAHGFGNKLTDAMEINAIAQGYRGVSHPIYVGSLKPNIGHLEATIGMGMLFKVIATLQNKKIAPNIHFNVPNEDIAWEKIPVKIPTEVIPLASSDKPLIAAINLSGYSGTNVHMIFQAAEEQKHSLENNQQAVLLTWSAKTKRALIDLVQKYLEDWERISTYNFSEFAYTLQTGRDQWPAKLSFSASNYEDTRKGLQAFIQESADYPYEYSIDADMKEVAFLFTGQGAQYKGMCQDYYESETVFRESFDECARILDEILPISIQEVIWGNVDESQIHQTFYTQPALFVVEYALAKLWMSRGIKPSALVGHSIGEYVALTIAEAMTLEDALNIVTARGELMQSLPEDIGSMAAVFTEESTLKPYIAQSNGLVDIAAVNAPKMVTITGDKQAVGNLCAVLKENKIKSIPLKVSHAFHSHLMEPILKDFEREVETVTFKEPTIPIVSNVTGRELTLSDLKPTYFSTHLRNAVRYADDVKYLNEELGIQIFLECGPAQTLSGLASKTLPQDSGLFLYSAKKGESASITQLKVLQALYHNEAKLDWQSLWQNLTLAKVSLPTYAWQREVYWVNPVRGMAQKEVQAPATSTETINYMKQEMVKSEAEKILVNKENVMAIMQLEAGEILGLKPGQKLDPKQSLREQGFDSMMSGEFLIRMERHIGEQLEMSLIHTYGSLNELKRYFIDQFLGGGEVDEGAEAVTMNDIVFGSDQSGAQEDEHWHEIKESDPKWLKVFKKIDKMISTPKE